MNNTEIAELLKEWEEKLQYYEKYSFIQVPYPIAYGVLNEFKEAVEVLKETAAGEATADYLAMDLLKKWGFLK